MMCGHLPVLNRALLEDPVATGFHEFGESSHAAPRKVASPYQTTSFGLDIVGLLQADLRLQRSRRHLTSCAPMTSRFRDRNYLARYQNQRFLRIGSGTGVMGTPASTHPGF